MAKHKKSRIPFDRKGGVVVIPLRMLESSAYRELKAAEKVLLILLQRHWRPDKPVDYGIREAAREIPCSRASAAKAFNQLAEKRFITCVIESAFSSRTESKTRSWQLEWMPVNNTPPSNYWEKQ